MTLGEREEEERGGEERVRGMEKGKKLTAASERHRMRTGERGGGSAERRGGERRRKSTW